MMVQVPALVSRRALLSLPYQISPVVPTAAKVLLPGAMVRVAEPVTRSPATLLTLKYPARPPAATKELSTNCTNYTKKSLQDFKTLRVSGTMIV
jgi:hypothetical protein